MRLVIGRPTEPWHIIHARVLTFMLSSFPQLCNVFKHCSFSIKTSLITYYVISQISLPSQYALPYSISRLCHLFTYEFFFQFSQSSVYLVWDVIYKFLLYNVIVSVVTQSWKRWNIPKSDHCRISHIDLFSRTT